MTERRDDIIILVDENGQEEEFEYIDSVEMKGNEYVVLSPLSSSEEEDDVYDFTDEIVILKVETNESGEEAYVTIEDENELDEVFEEFRLKMEDEYDFDISDEDFEIDYEDDEDKYSDEDDEDIEDDDEDDEGKDF